MEDYQSKKALELDVHFERVCLRCALEDVVRFLYFVECEVCEEVRNDCQLQCTGYLLPRLMSLTVSHHHCRCIQLTDRQQVEDARDCVRAD